MKKYICPFVLWSTFGLLQAYNNQDEPIRRKEMNHVGGYFMQKRVPRSVAKGVKAIRHLMKGVYEVPTSSRNYKKYIKYGAEQEAIDDFWSAKPAYHKSITTRAGDTTTDGYIGSVMFRLNTKDRSQHGKPTISLRTKNGKLNVKIVYLLPTKGDV